MASGKRGRHICSLLLLCSMLISIACLRVASAMPFSSAARISLAPDQLVLSGDVATQKNTLGTCVAPWLAGMPAGSIMLGVNPASCDPSAWRGGSATARISLPASYSPTVYSLVLKWPDGNGRGLHSPEPTHSATITFDGQPLWGKRTTTLSTGSHYYAAEHEPIVTTVVVKQSGAHTLTITVPAHTVWDLSSITLQAYPAPQHIHGIGYSPYRDCQYPGGAAQPATADIEQDLARLGHTSNAIRTYAATGPNAEVPRLANKLGLPVYAGGMD